ncbi:MAG: nitroreductase family protein [Pseudomonadota bacterium]
MCFKNPLFELMENRCSWRSYSSNELAHDLIDRLRHLLASPPPTPFGNISRVVFLEKFQSESHKPLKLGTYGMIHGAKNFLAGLTKPADHAMEDFGHTFEWAILQATDLGLATCWLGGTLKRGAFAESAGAKDNEIVAAASPIGYPTAKRGILDSLVRLGAGSKNRKNWNDLFFENDFSQILNPQVVTPWSKALEMIRLAPSASNRQPWRIIYQAKSQRFDFFVKRTKMYSSLTSVDLQRIDMGIAMCHFELSCKQLGINGKWGKLENTLAILPEQTEYVASWISL